MFPDYKVKQYPTGATLADVAAHTGVSLAALRRLAPANVNVQMSRTTFNHFTPGAQPSSLFNPPAGCQC